MLDYTKSKHFEAWQKHSKWKYLKYATLASILHICLLFLGYQRLMRIFFAKTQKLQVRYYLDTPADVKSLKKRVNPVFKKIKKSRIFPANCLSSSILLWYVLRKQGLDTKLSIGTTKEDKDFKAHAWVEYQQIPLNENRKVKTQFQVFEHDFANLT